MRICVTKDFPTSVRASQQSFRPDGVDDDVDGEVDDVFVSRRSTERIHRLNADSKEAAAS